MEPTRPTYLHITPLEKGLFYTLIFAGVSLLVWQVWQMRQVWQKGQPANWKTDPLRSVWRYILGQRKVQGSRPKSGAPMHLLIFYGFLALLIATTLLAISEYGQLIGIPDFHKGAYFLGYELAADVMGAIFLFGCAWALGRRLLFRFQKGRTEINPETGRPTRSANPLGDDASDLWVLVLLIALGKTGFLVEGARMALVPQPWDGWAPIGKLTSTFLAGFPAEGYKAIWWIHAVLVATFFAVLPRLRLKHIVVATLTAAGVPERSMGALEPISMESVEKTGKIGVSEPTDYSRWHLQSLDACMSCGRCTEVCPAWNAGKSLNPKFVVADIHRAIRTGENVAAAVTEDALWACTTCSACVEACPVLIRHVDLIVDARRSLAAEGSLSGSGAVMLRQLGSTKHAWGQKADAREDWMKGLEIPLARNGVPFDYLFWVGCAGATDPGAVKTTKAVASLLRKAGISFACLGKEEACTGDPARRIGDEFLFQEQVDRNGSVFAKYGVRKVVTACPHCFNSLANEYSQFGHKLEVHHHTQLLASLVQQRELSPVPVAPGAVTIHDPCYLARVNGEVDAPRILLGEQGGQNTSEPALLAWLNSEPNGKPLIAEPGNRGVKTLCCGAGGGRMWMDDEPSVRPSVRRAKELTETGATTVAVACPFCRIMLDPEIQKASDSINIVDLAEMLNEANQ